MSPSGQVSAHLLAEAEDRGYRLGYEAGIAAMRKRRPTRGDVPFDRSLAGRFPDLVDQWHPTRNDVGPADVFAGSKHRAWWQCPKGHEWAAIVSSRGRGVGCPSCAYDRLGSVHSRPHGLTLAQASAVLSAQWHPSRNGDLTPETVMASSGKMVWWRCDVGHEWEAKPNDRRKGTGRCPVCTGYRLTPSTNLAAVRPDVAAEWHPTRNGVARPEKASPKSNRRVWWQCADGHEWETEICKRTDNRRPGRCPFCAGKRVDTASCLATTHPHLAAEWHPTRNAAVSPRQVGAGSGKHVWWLCVCGYEWRARVDSRAIGGRGCSACISVTTSKPEQELRRRLAEVLPVDSDHPPIPSAFRPLHCDIVAPSLRLVVEFDGRYWHDGKLGSDKAKNTLLRKQGWRVIRVRERPLPPTGPDDVLIDANDLDAAVLGVLGVVNRWNASAAAQAA